MTAPTCAVVVGGQLNGLGVVRSLARGGVPTIVVDSSYRRAAMWSRFSRPVIVERIYGRGFVDQLLKLQRGFGHRPVLFLTDEMAVHTVSSHREELAAAYRFQLPSPDMVAILDNKARFHRFAEQNGLPVPRTVVFNHVSDFSKLRHLQFPIIVKPADRRLVYLSPAQRLHMPANIREAETLCERLLQTLGEFVIQEWIEGDDSNIYFCLFYRGPDRARTMMFSGRKLLSHPPRAGSTALCVAAPEVGRELESFTSKFIGLCEYRGLGSLEFKWDRTRRTFVVIEPTVGRTDWQEEVATLNGVNLPLAAYRDELELPAEATPVPPPLVLWQESARHWPARYALGLRRQTYDGYWRANDPAPAVAYYGNAIFKRICRQLSELVHAGERNRRRKFSVSKQP